MTAVDGASATQHENSVNRCAEPLWRNPGWNSVGLLAFTALGSYLCRTNVSFTGTLIMRDLGLSEIDMGSLFSVFVLGYALFQIPAGNASDRWGTPFVLGLAALCWVVLTLLISMLGIGPLNRAPLQIFTLLLVLRFLLGVAESPTFPAAARGIAEWIPANYRGSANGVVLGAVGVASAVAPPLLSRVMIHFGWRPALLISALPALVAGSTWMFVLGKARPKNQIARAPALTEESTGTLWSGSFALLILSYTIEGYVSYIFIFWFYLYLTDVRHFNLAESGTLSSLPGLFSILSIPLGGVISDKLTTGRMGLRWGRATVAMVGLSFSGLFLIFGAATNNARAAVIYLALATAFVLSVEGPAWATLIEIAAKRSGTSAGIMNCGSNIGGAVSPLLTPILAARIGWKNALFVAAALSILGATLWLGIDQGSTAKGQVLES